ncbi:MAG TPA: hypothetical protein DCL44_11405 [Elusimicrobia bacterium]|nr:hypothetical protein [Elusimicrobiota bacterium]
MIQRIEQEMEKLLLEKHGLDYLLNNAADDIVAKIKNMESGVFLVEGLPGIGKSASMKYIANAVGAHNPERVVHFYFSLNNPVLDNADNYYEYTCDKIRIIMGVADPAVPQIQTSRRERKDYNDFQQSVLDLSSAIGKDDEKKVYFFIDGIEEMRDYKEFLSYILPAEGVIYVIFAQPGVCNGSLPVNFLEHGKIKNRVEVKYLNKTHAREFFWKVFGKAPDAEFDVFESKVRAHFDSYIETEENRCPLLLKILAEDAKEDGFNLDRAWAIGLEGYLDGRVKLFSENAKKLLVLVALAKGPLQSEDLVEMTGLSRAVCDGALNEAKKFLIINGQGIVISHNVWAKLISDRWGDKSSYEVYLTWCANWSNPSLRQETAVYIARHYVFHVLDFSDRWSDGSGRAEELLLELYKDSADEYVGFQLNTLFPLGESLTDISRIAKKAFVRVSSSQKFKPELVVTLVAVICQIEGSKRADFTREYLSAANRKGIDSEIDKGIIREVATSVLAMIGCDEAGLVWGLLPIETGVDKKWDDSQALCYLVSEKIFREMPSEENKLLIFDTFLQNTRRCLEGDAVRLKSATWPENVKLVYQGLRVWLNIYAAFQPWLKLPHDSRNPKVKVLAKHGAQYEQGILLWVNALFRCAKQISKEKSGISGVEREMLNRIQRAGILAQLKIKPVIWNMGPKGATCRADEIVSLSCIIICEQDVVARRAAAEGLIEIGDSTACEALIYGLKNDTDVQVRARSATALGKIGDPCAQEPLIEAINDEFEEVRVAVKTALEKLRPAK